MDRYLHMVLVLHQYKMVWGKVTSLIIYKTKNCLYSVALANLGTGSGEGMPRLVRALSDHTNIKELHIKQLRFGCLPVELFAPQLLRSMLRLLSASTPPAFFPSLQILKVTAGIGPGLNNISDCIEGLFSSIKAVRPNLKTIILRNNMI